MVNVIDIHKLTLEELAGIISLYPWYGAARMEYFARMSGLDAISDSQLAETALHVGSRRRLSELVLLGRDTDCTDTDAMELVEISGSDDNLSGRKIIVAGGDYFTQKDYDSVRRTDDSIFSRFAREARREGYVEPVGEDAEDFCTEALAKIYLEQDYPDEAIAIYSKLSLRYPEKSVYFATLIDEINKNR
ncbi:MAG: hypothetical protein MJY89_08900 [Bacteroidales bacterium]|nr:hypothetical protein [Bacteroidales bacterium]